VSVRFSYVDSTLHSEVGRTAYTYTGKDFVRLELDLRDVPTQLRKMLDRRLRSVGDVTVAAVRRHASWSSRIPGAVHLRVRFTGKDPGLLIYVDAAAAPHARPYEGLLKDSFRHPVFGDVDVWVSQDVRRFVWPGVQETQQQVADAVDEAIAAAFHAAGFG